MVAAEEKCNKFDSRKTGGKMVAWQTETKANRDGGKKMKWREKCEKKGMQKTTWPERENKK
jgi:hypothetical protein